MAKSRNTSDSNFESHALQFQTAVEHVWPQLVLAWLMCLLSNAIYWLVKGYNVAAVDDVIDDSNDFHYQPSNAWIPIDVEAMHGIVGQILGFLIVFRSSQSYGSFVEGRKILGDIANNLRELSMNTYTFHVREELTDDAALVAELREKVRRQINLLYAVVRQQIREKQEGFEPGCLIEGKPFEENWQLDVSATEMGITSLLAFLVHLYSRLYFHMH